MLRKLAIEEFVKRLLEMEYLVPLDGQSAEAVPNGLIHRLDILNTLGRVLFVLVRHEGEVGSLRRRQVGKGRPTLWLRSRCSEETIVANKARFGRRRHAAS